MLKKSLRKRISSGLKKKRSFKFQRKHLLWFLCVMGLALFLPGFLSQLEKKDECANSVSCIEDLTGHFDASVITGSFMGNSVVVPQSTVSFATNQILGENTSNKKIHIDLSTQRLYAKEGDATIMEFPVSTGKWSPTPTGNFKIWIKLRYTKMEGGKKATNTYYYLPNVPYTMYFYNDAIPKWKGYGIHGAYWHNNFGHPMSHGCVNMKTEDVAQLYAWAAPVASKNVTYASSDNPGTEIFIYGITPKE